MKILVISKSGDGFGIAQKLQEEGHTIRFYVKESGFDYVLNGILPQVHNWEPSARDWADFVISDMVGFGKLATKLAAMNVVYLGFNQIGDLMELDRGKQMQLFTRFNIGIPETEEFANPAQGNSITDNWEDPGYVIKPSGNLDTGKTYVIRDKDTFTWALEQYSGDQDLVVQKIVNGVEISTEGWFDGIEWAEPFNHTIELKRFMNDDIGPNTGCMGNVVWRAKNDKLVQNLKKLTPFLRHAEFRGPIDINTIVNSSGIYALELTTRFGYDAVEGLYESLSKKCFGDILLDLATKTNQNDPIQIPMREGFTAVVRLTVPPYPFDKAKPSERGLPVIGIPHNLESIYPADIYKNNGQFFWSASDGVLCKVAAFNEDLDKAIEEAYLKVNKISAQGLQYRTDVGCTVRKSINLLKTWGYM
jgi:phosphoribosylamine--glycine ligase